MLFDVVKQFVQLVDGRPAKRPQTRSDRGNGPGGEDLPAARPRSMNSGPALIAESVSRHNTGENNIRQEIMGTLTEQSREFAEAQHQLRQSTREQETALRASLVSVVQRVFAVMDPCVAELNATVGLADLKVSLTPPAMVTETIKYNSLRDPVTSVSAFRGRVSTSCQSVVIKGHGNIVDFYFLPADKVVGLSFAEQQYKPAMHFVATINGDGIIWEVEGKPLTEARLEKYSLIVFKHLIETTIEELKTKP